jgi:hypothetical protein
MPQSPAPVGGWSAESRQPGDGVSRETTQVPPPTAAEFSSGRSPLSPQTDAPASGRAESAGLALVATCRMLAAGAPDDVAVRPLDGVVDAGIGKL